MTVFFGQETSGGGALQSIANFFHNIGPKKKSDKKNRDSSDSLTLPDIEQNGSLTSSSAGHSPRPPSTPRGSKSPDSTMRRFKEKPIERNYTCAQIK